VIDFIAAQVDFPEIDVRQRLTVSKGYGASEIYVPEGSKFVGVSITDTKLKVQDINVLTLYRGNKVIPNPKQERILEANRQAFLFWQVRGPCAA
jgi:ribosomal protein S6--L-glutamate ligase